MRTADELIDSIIAAAGIPHRGRRRDVSRELRCHVEDFVFAAQAAGHTDSEIERLFAANFGDAAQISGQFSRVYARERAAARCAVVAVSACGAAAATLALALLLQSVLSPSLVRSLTSHHTWFEARDILSTAAFYAAIRSARPLNFIRAFLLGAVSIALAFILPASCLFGLIAALGLHCLSLVPNRPLRFALTGLCFSALGVWLWSRFSTYPLASAAANWFVMGIAYQCMTAFVPRIDQRLTSRLFEG